MVEHRLWANIFTRDQWYLKNYDLWPDVNLLQQPLNSHKHIWPRHHIQTCSNIIYQPKLLLHDLHSDQTKVVIAAHGITSVTADYTSTYHTKFSPLPNRMAEVFFNREELGISQTKVLTEWASGGV